MFIPLMLQKVALIFIFRDIILPKTHRDNKVYHIIYFYKVSLSFHSNAT